MSDCRRVSDLDPKNVDNRKLIHFISRSLCVRRRFREAINIYDELLRLDPHDATALQYQGRAYCELYEFKKSIAKFERALAIKPDDPILRRDLEWARKAEGRFVAQPPSNRNGIATAAHSAPATPSPRGNQQTANNLAKSIAQEVNWAKTLQATFRVGQINLQEGHWATALDCFDAVVISNEHHAQARAQRAWLRAACPDAKFRDAKLAYADARKACELTGWKDSASLEALAAAYAESGQFDEAVKWQQFVVRQFPNAGKPAAERLERYAHHQPARLP